VGQAKSCAFVLPLSFTLGITKLYGAAPPEAAEPMLRLSTLAHVEVRIACGTMCHRTPLGSATG